MRTRASATWPILVGALVAGLLADQLFRAATFGLAATAVFTFAAILLAFTGRIERLEPRIMLAASALFAAWMSLRASPWLVWPDLAASLLLLGIAASLSVKGSLYDLAIVEIAARALHGLAHITTGIGFVSRPLADARRRLSLLGPVLRGLLLAIPIATVLSLLLASADPVFASFFQLNVDPAQLLQDVIFITAGVIGMAGLLRLAHSQGVDRVDGPRWRLGTIEALIVLALLDAVFAAFAIAQLLAATGAAADTLRAAGITYADYARSGFFQLLWVSGITLVVLVLFSRITGFERSRQTVAFVALAETAIVLTVLIVIVAFRRLSLYEEAYGLTMLRLYSHIFAGWISIVFLLLAVDILGGSRRWFAGATLTSALVVLLTLNFANPEAVVVTLNVDHARFTHKLDASYFTELTSDATPTLVDSIGRVDPSLRAPLRSVACAGDRTYSPSLAAFNWSGEDAAAARRESC